ncbi:PIN domain-containing protein [Flavobacterium sp.]|jgi:predicted nucleic acid-binding protein|uniref:PIN domain-containing protein n=1 Tax=Flavobacterium sp. TaxID=239 RepID=UPI0037BFF341
MSGNKILLDTNVIIYASKQILDIDKFINSYEEYYVSIITYLEVYGYEFSNSNEKDLVDELFNNIQIIDLNKEISEFVIEIRKNKIKKIKLPDAIILATSKFLDIPLLTADWDDFLSIDETIIIKNLDSLKK